jgi:Uma2 family endonuclease
MENSVVIPDVAIVGLDQERTIDPAEVPHGAPLLAVEVVSSETAETLEHKIKLYLRNGSKIVIVAYPLERSIRVHDASRNAKDLEQDQFLELPELLPGFRVQVAKFFEGI